MRILQRLASAKLTAIIMAIAAGGTLVSFLVPQRSVVGESIYQAWKADVGKPMVSIVEALGLEHVFTSWPFLVVFALLAVNLVACMARRMLRHQREVHHVILPPAAAELPVRVDKPELHVMGALKGWQAYSVGDGQWTYRSGERGWWGSMVMHLGLLVLLVAGLTSSVTRFSGTMVLAEGQQVRDEAAAYYTIAESPRFGSAFTGAELGLHSMDFTYDGGTIVDAVAWMTRLGEPRDVPVRVNYPLRAKGKSYLLSETGLAAELRVAQGTETLAEGVVNLGKRVPEGYADEFPLPDGRTLVATAVPDRAIAPGSTAEHVYILTNPVVRFGMQGLPPVELAPGQNGEIGGLSVTVASVRRWTSFNVRADKGLPIAYVGFALVLFGTIARWLDPEVRLTLDISADGSSARMWHVSRYGTASAERAVARVEKALAGDEDA